MHLHRTNKNEVSQARMPLLINLILPSINSFRRRSNICWWILLVGLFCRLIFARVISRPVLLASVGTILARSPSKCAKHGFSVYWYPCLFFLKSSFSVIFNSVFILNSYLIRSAFSKKSKFKCCGVSYCSEE